VPRALEKLRPGGTLAINAIHMTPIPEMPYDLIYGERTLRSVANLTRRDGAEFFRLVEEMRSTPKTSLRSTVTRYPLSDANRALLDVKHSRINGEAVLMIG
jgi:propanol-preferring alcohol dehydrogenase